MKSFVYSLLTAHIKDTHASGILEGSRIQVEEVGLSTQLTQPNYELIDNKIQVAINLEGDPPASTGSEATSSSGATVDFTDL